MYCVSAAAVIAGVVPSTDTTLAASALSTYRLVVKSFGFVIATGLLTVPTETLPANHPLPE